MFKFRSSLFLTAALLGALAVSQGNAAPADTIQSRQKNLKEVGDAFKTVRDQVRVSSPDMTAIAAAGQTIKKHADAMSTWFPKGTGSEVGVKTAAKPEVWSDPAGFETARTNFVAAATKFADITKSGDKAAISAGIGPMGGACKGCHDKYRIKED
jgi:cytochrome c556